MTNCTECEFFEVRESEKKVPYWRCRKEIISNISGKVFAGFPKYCGLTEEERDGYTTKVTV